MKGKLDREATTDRVKIRFWVEHGHHDNFAMRIRKGSKLVVVDTENAFKHPGKIGPDGELFFNEMLEEHNITLPPCPMVATPTGGFHRALLAPKFFPVCKRISLWPGVDILAAGSNVILPGSRTDDGIYRALRSFTECPIPEAPEEFAKLIRQSQRGKNRSRALRRRPCRRSLMVLNHLCRAGNGTFFSRTRYSVPSGIAKKRSGTRAIRIRVSPRKGMLLLRARGETGRVCHQDLASETRPQPRPGATSQRILPAAWDEVEAWVSAWQRDNDAGEGRPGCSENVE